VTFLYHPEIDLREIAKVQLELAQRNVRNFNDDSDLMNGPISGKGLERAEKLRHMILRGTFPRPYQG
jgi:hypothetical protein